MRYEIRAQKVAESILATIRSEPEYRRLADDDSQQVITNLSDYFERRLIAYLQNLPGKLAERVQAILSRRFARIIGIGT